MSAKNSFRRMVLEKRKNIPAVSRRAKSKKIFKRLIQTSVFQRSAHIAFYCGITPEVSTQSFLKAALKDKKIYLPRVQLRKKRLQFHRVRSLGDLRRGPYGILEPKPSCAAIPAKRLELIIVPGVAFDRRGGRLGRGAGYYDRFLKKAKQAVKVGLCFREQIVKKIPMKHHDVRMDRIITD